MSMVGRPPKPDEERREGTLRIRLTKEERAVLDAAANGANTSTWARKVLLNVARRRKKNK
jgi:uncharacterized protein (DUF1778 family)